jgi:isopropylmalate/homocitrate/citramalate synthase
MGYRLGVDVGGTFTDVQMGDVAMHVTVCDVGPRDGLQNDREILSPVTRAELCDRLSATGLPRIEAGSFVNPNRVPQMAGAEEVFAALHRDPDVTYAALALNRRGVERALAAAADELHLAYPLSDTFAQRNQGVTLAEAAEAAELMIGQAHDAGVRASVTLGASFGCPFEGPVDPGVVSEHVARMAAAGADELMLADTIGVGVPAQVRRLLPQALRQAGGRPVGLHLHNTRNNGYANAVAGLEHGASILDASIGGLGGCPFAPRATGNIATEDLVYLLDGEGVDTGVDLDGLIATSEWLAGVLGRDLPGLVYRAGPFVPTGPQKRSGPDASRFADA